MIDEPLTDGALDPGTWGLELSVEGPTDASTHRNQGSDQSAGGDDYGGALIPIVRRTLQELSGHSAPAFDRMVPAQQCAAVRLSHIFLSTTHMGGRRRPDLGTRAHKLVQAVVNRHLTNPARDRVLLVILWDRDGQRSKVTDRDQFNIELKSKGYPGVVAGVCVEEVEAWLLADVQALAGVFGSGPRHPPTSPEALNDPKTALYELLNTEYGGWTDHFGVDERSKMYARLAEKIRLDELERMCPDGYGCLRKDLDQAGFPANFRRR